MDRDTSRDLQPAPSGGNDFSQPAKAAPPAEIPDHTLLRKIGSGSYGDVWLARNMMGMYRAVKIVYRNRFDNQRPFERELSGIRRFEPISRSHEGFVDVLHVGMREQEYFYYVMELGDDKASDQKIEPDNYVPKTLALKIGENGKLSFDQCLKLGLGISDALAELHKHGLVHRDVKPSNIIFVNGAPKLADIGLVATTAEARSYVGTEGFIPPEGPGAPSADVYSLGKVLYEASTGKDRNQFPELPTLLDKFPDQEKFFELNEIILRACRPDAKTRYQTARDLHSDLVVLASGKSVKRLKILERRFARLKKAAGLAATALIVATLIAYPIYREHRDVVETRERQIGANVANGTRALDTGDYLGALPYFAEALFLKDKMATRADRVRFASALAQCPKLVQMWACPQRVTSVDFDRTGERVIIAEQSSTRIYDVKTGKSLLPAFEGDGGTSFGAFSSDGKFALSPGEDHVAIVWSLDHSVEPVRLDHPDRVVDAEFSPDGGRVVTACNDNLGRIWNARTGALELLLKGHGKGNTMNGLRLATFSHNGKLVATAGCDGTARLWDARTGQELKRTPPNGSWVTCAAFSPDDSLLAIGGFDRLAHVWDISSWREIPPAMKHGDAVSRIQFSPDESFLITSGLDRVTCFWQASNHQPLDSNPTLWDSDRVNCVAVAPDAHRIATASEDGIVRVWDIAATEVTPLPMQGEFSGNGRRFARAAGRTIQIFDTLSNQIPVSMVDADFVPGKIKFDSSGNFLFASDQSQKSDELLQTIKIFSASNGEQVGATLSISNSFNSLALSTDGKWLLGCGPHWIQMWDVTSGKPLWPAVKHDANAALAGFSPDLSKFAFRASRKAFVCDSRTGRELFPALTNAKPVTFVEFSPDSSRVVIGGSNPMFDKCNAQIWDALTGQPIGAPLKHNDGVLYAAFSPDGQCIVTASEDFSAIVWDANTGRQITPPLKHANQVWKAAFSPDGKWVATASVDGTARVWSAETGEPLTAPLRHLGGQTEVNFLDDGEHLLTGNASGFRWMWSLPDDERPTEDLRKLAWLLSSGTIEPVGASGSLRSHSLISLFNELRQKYPEQFFVGENQIATWHDFQAKASEAKSLWQTAAFHLERLKSIEPENNAVQDRLAHARKQLLAPNTTATYDSASKP
jgi:WD40 repeat protein